MTVIPATGINFGFTGSDVLNNSASLVEGLATFVILGLAVAFAPKLIGIIKGIFRGGNRA